eukprot:2921066-Rhodomonas_salina.5
MWHTVHSLCIARIDIAYAATRHISSSRQYRRSPPMVLRPRYAVSGTDRGYAATSCTAHVVYAPSEPMSSLPAPYDHRSLAPYEHGTPCLVLTCISHYQLWYARYCRCSSKPPGIDSYPPMHLLRRIQY